MFAQNASANTLTGAILYSADSTGAYGNQVWNTAGGPTDFFYNLYLKDGIAFVNSDNASSVSINIALAGVQPFDLFAQDAGFRFQYVGLNLFFDGSITPGISLLAQVDDPTHTFGINSSSSTPAFDSTDLSHTHVTPAAGSASFSANGLTTLATHFLLQSPEAYAQDQVSQFNNVPGGLGPGYNNDFH